MSIFCILHIISDVRDSLPPDFLPVLAHTKWGFVDNASEEQRNRRMRFRRAVGLEDVPIPRYHWQLNSDGMVGGGNIENHFLWVISQIKVDPTIREILGDDFQYWFSVFWQDQGIGGGPVITVQIAEMLARHQAKMEISFYAAP